MHHQKDKESFWITKLNKELSQGIHIKNLIKGVTSIQETKDRILALIEDHREHLTKEAEVEAEK